MRFLKLAILVCLITMLAACGRNDAAAIEKETLSQAETAVENVKQDTAETEAVMPEQDIEEKNSAEEATKEKSIGEEPAEEVQQPKPQAEETGFSFHTEAQAQYLAGDYKLYKQYANGTEELSAPIPYVLENGEEKYNLLLGETYIFTYTDENGNEKSEEVVTDDTPPRNLYVKGVTNVRDLGGWSIGDGGRVRQGMLLRSAKFNGDESAELLISPEGIDTMVSVFGIRTEIDLREDDERGGITESPLGSSVKYISLPFQSGGNIILLNRDKLPELFAVLGDEANYPIVFHCSIGTDRTGMVAFLINGLLGVSEEDLYRDFLFSNFGEIGKLRTPSIIKTYIETVEMSAGNSLAEQIKTYLTNAGVATEDIESLIRIMTEQ